MQISTTEFYSLSILATLVFLLAPASLLIYVQLYNSRKKRHIEEKQLMTLTFEAELSKTQLEVSEQTMQTIGSDLHDSIGQLLSLSALTLGAIRLEQAENARQKIDSVIELTATSISELRQLGKLIQGEQLIGIGLDEAIKRQVEWIRKSGQFEVDYVKKGTQPTIGSKDKDLIIFRIFQEILSNSIKYSNATCLKIELEYHNNLCGLIVTDNGSGFNPDKQSENEGMGLRNITKRSKIVGGEAFIQSQIGQGTSITALIPYP